MKRPKPKAKQRPKPKPKPKWVHLRADKLRPLLREAARTGLVEAIEHCGNFWSVSDGFKKYIEQQVASQAEALLAAVRSAVRSELTLLAHASRKRRR